MTTRRYQWQGVDVAVIQAAIGGTATVQLGCVLYVLVTYDETSVTSDAVDEAMGEQGYVYAPPSGGPANAVLAFTAPNTNVFGVEVDNSGTLSTVQQF